MGHDTFWFEVVESATGRVVSLHGELDVAEADRLCQSLLALADADMEVDLGALRFVDSSGLTALVRVRGHVTCRGHSFRLQGARGGVRRALELSGMLGLLEEP